MYPKRVDAGTVVRRVGDEVLVFESECHRLHHLNAAAALIWKLCDGLHSSGQMVDELQEMFDVPRETLTCDVEAALQVLTRSGLIAHQGQGGVTS